MDSNVVKSGIICAVEGCNSSRRQNIRLFKLQKTHKKYEEWINNCNLKKSATKNIQICEKHFSEGCFTKNGLRRTAVPTKNLPVISINNLLSNDNTTPVSNQTKSLLDSDPDDNGKMITILMIFLKRSIRKFL